MLLVLMSLALLEPPSTPTTQGPPIAWSPDGRWLAYVQAVRPMGPGFEPGWLLGGVAEPPPATGEARCYRIWATRPEAGESVKLAESTGPMSSPCWHPDGTAIAYERVEGEGSGRVRQLIVQEGPEARRVVWSRPFPVGLGASAVGSMPMVAPSWSVDGRHLAVPDVGPASIAIVRVADGKVVRTVEGGFAPAWSDDGKLAYLRDDALYWMDARLATSRRLADVPEAASGPAPIWSRDGLSVFYVRRGHAPRRFPFAAIPQTMPVEASVQLFRVRIETGVVESRDPLLHDQVPSLAAIRGISVALGRDFGEVYTAMEIQGVPSQMMTLRPRGAQEIEILGRNNPVDYVLPIGTLSAAPGSRRVAARLGPPGLFGVPVVCDPNGPGLTPIAADDRARVEWVSSLVGLARTLLAVGRKPGDRYDRRPSLVPLPGVLVADESVGGRLRHIAEIGRPLCDRPSDPSPDPSTRAFFAEARLFFDLLLSDYASARADLPAYAPTAASAEARARLMGLRAQIDIGLGEVDRARSAIDYLRTTSGGEPQQIEEAGAGFVLTPLPGPIGWISGLSEALSGRASKPADPSASRMPSVEVAPPIPPEPIPPERDLPVIESTRPTPPPPPIRPF